MRSDVTSVSKSILDVVGFPVPTLACGLETDSHGVPLQDVPENVPVVCSGQRMETGMRCHSSCAVIA
jgi:hypothetical protein